MLKLTLHCFALLVKDSSCYVFKTLWNTCKHIARTRNIPFLRQTGRSVLDKIYILRNESMKIETRERASVEKSWKETVVCKQESIEERINVKKFAISPAFPCIIEYLFIDSAISVPRKKKNLHITGEWHVRAFRESSRGRTSTALNVNVIGEFLSDITHTNLDRCRNLHHLIILRNVETQM